MGSGGERSDGILYASMPANHLFMTWELGPLKGDGSWNDSTNQHGKLGVTTGGGSRRTRQGFLSVYQKKNVVFPFHFSELSTRFSPLSYVPVPMWPSTSRSATLCLGSSFEHQDHRNSHSLYLACGLLFVRIPQAYSSFTPTSPTVDLAGENVLKMTQEEDGKR